MHLGAVLTEYQVHYNTARPHQGIAQRVPDREHDGDHLTVVFADLDRGRILRKPVLSGLINEYARVPPDIPKNRRSRHESYFRAGQGCRMRYQFDLVSAAACLADLTQHFGGPAFAGCI